MSLNDDDPFGLSRNGVSFAASPAASGGSTGEHIGGLKGGVGVAGISDAASLRITVVDKNDFGSESCCGGIIGGKNGSKMCVKENCTVSAHKTKKASNVFVFLEEDGLNRMVEKEYDRMVFVGTNGGLDPPTSVFMDPKAPASYFGDSLYEQLRRDLPIDQWRFVMNALKPYGDAEEGMSDETEREALLERLTEDPRNRKDYLATPKRAKLDTLGSLSPSSDDFVKVLEPVAKIGDLPSSERPAKIVEGWDALVDHVTKFSGLASELSKLRDKDQDELDDRLTQLSVSCGTLKALVGNRAEGTLDGTTVIACVSRVIQDLNTVSTRVEDLGVNLDALTAWKLDLTSRLTSTVSNLVSVILNSSGALDNRVKEIVNDRLFGTEGVLGDESVFKKKFVDPMVQLLGATSRNAPGDLLESRLQGLSNEIDALKSRIQAGGSALGNGGLAGGNAASASQGTGTGASWLGGSGSFGATGGMSAFGTAAGVPAPAPVPPPVPLPTTDMEAKIRTLEDKVSALCSQLDSDIVEIDGRVFKSQDDAGAWLVANGAERYPFLFVDLISLLLMADVIKSDPLETTQQRAASAKVGDSSAMMSNFIGSFDVEVPKLFGKNKDPDTEVSSKALANVPTYEAWNTGTGRDGIKDRLSKLVKEGQKKILAEISLYLRGDAREVAKEMVNNSATYWTTISTWLTTHYLEYLTRSEATEAEVWELITSCMREVFSLFRKARLVGGGGTAAQMFWGTLQCHRVCQELSDSEIKGHPNLAMIINDHLIDNAVPLSRYNKLEAEFQALKKEVATIKGTADKALNAAKKK